MEDGSDTPRIILHSEDAGGVLNITVGPFEASAIIVALEGISPPRPLTHDLLAELFRRHRFQLECVEIYDTDEDRFLSRLRYRDGAQSHVMEVRPSDGIALASRLKAPIFAPGELANRNASYHPYVHRDHERSGEQLFFPSGDSKPPIN